VFIGYAESSKAYRIFDPGTQRVHTTRDVVFDEGRGWTWDKAVDDGSTPTYDNFTVEYVHFEGAGGVGSSLPPSMSTPIPEPPPTSASATPPGTSTPAPARSKWTYSTVKLSDVGVEPPSTACTHAKPHTVSCR
jgi:hypothetical protein